MKSNYNLLYSIIGLLFWSYRMAAAANRPNSYHRGDAWTTAYPKNFQRFNSIFLHDTPP